MLTSAPELSQDFIMVSKRTHHLRALWAFVVYRVRHMCDIPHTRGFWSGLECPEFDAAEGGPGQRGLDHVSTRFEKGIRGPVRGRGYQ